MSFQIRKYLKFIIAGGLSALTSLVLFYVFITFLNIWYLLASTISFLLSIAVGFYLQKYLTFKNFRKGDTKKQALSFLFFSLLNLLINIALMAFFVEIIQIDKMFSKILTLGILACWNFFVYEKFVFAERNLISLIIG
jgi:putative flippase GtrA